MNLSHIETQKKPVVRRTFSKEPQTHAPAHGKWALFLIRLFEIPRWILGTDHDYKQP